MTKEEIHTEVYKLLFEDSRDLNSSDFKELLSEVISDCEASLEALENDETDE